MGEHAASQRRAYLVAVVHDVVNCDEGFKYNHPVVDLCSLNEQIGHLWH